MFRITSCLITSRRLLYRRPRLDIQLLPISRNVPSLKYKKPQEREPCAIPPPPLPPPPKDDKAFWGAVAFVFLAAGFVGYAKSNPEIRDWLTLNAPWLDDFIALAFQENMTYGEFAQQCIEDITDYLNTIVQKPKDCTLDKQPPSLIGPLPEEKPDEIKETEGDYIIVNFSELDSEPDVAVQEELQPCDKLKPPILTKDICEIEKCLKELGDTAIHNYMTARDACIYYNKLVEETMEKFTVTGMKALHEATEERIALVDESVANASDAAAKLDEMIRYFGCGIKASKEAIQNTKDMLYEYSDKVKLIKMQWQWENDRSLAMDAQWQKVEEIIDKYTEENKTMFKNLDYESDNPSLVGDADLLLHHSLRYVEQLNVELADAMVSMTERVNRGLETLPQGEKEVKARNADIQALYKKRFGEMEAELKLRFNNKKSDNDKFLKDSLKKQLEKSQETLTLRLGETEISSTAKLEKLVADKVAADKKAMANELSIMRMNVHLIEDKLNARLKAERETRRSQELWVAGASLLAATKKGDPHVKVDKELRAIEKASGDGDKLVITVLKAIPDSVKEQGVVPESVLREKYRSMENVALKVALVEQEGAPLLVYCLSYIQYMFLFMKISGIPQAEFDKPPKEPSKELDTFDLLQRSRFWIERGNIAYALRYVAALSGASRAAAAAWHDAARDHLETRQAAEAVLAHAAAMGLQYI